MTGLITKLVFNRILKETRENHQGHDDDPYFEIVPTKKLSTFSGKSRMKKRRKALPPGLSEEDQAILIKVKRRAYRLDMALGSFCGFKIGWGSVIGIVPGIGDVLDTLLALVVVRTAATAHLPTSVLAHMLLNVAFDFVVGLVPFLGDLADMAYKANTRNAVVLEDYLRQRGRENLRKSGQAIPIDLSLADFIEEDDAEEGMEFSGQPVAQPQPAYRGGGESSRLTGNRREYDPESHHGRRGGNGGGSSREPRRHKSSSRDKKDRSSKEKQTKGHTRLFSQETGTTSRR